MIKWTLEKLQEEVNTCKDRKEFRKNNNAFIAAYSKNLLDELFKNHPNNGYRKKPDGYWSKEKLQEEANKYKTRWEFGEKDSVAYNMALRKKLMSELFKNHSNQGYNENHKKSGYWTKNQLQKEANKYKTRREFQKNSSGYGAAFEKDLLNDIFKNHSNKGYINKEEWIENNYVIYVYELTEYNRAYVGLTNNIKRRDLEHIFSNDSISKFCKNNNISYPNYKILEEKLNSTDAQAREEYWLNLYINNEWKMFNLNKTGSLGAIYTKWSKIALQEEVNNDFFNRLFNRFDPGHFKKIACHQVACRFKPFAFGSKNESLKLGKLMLEQGNLAFLSHQFLVFCLGNYYGFFACHESKIQLQSLGK